MLNSLGYSHVSYTAKHLAYVAWYTTAVIETMFPETFFKT